MLLIYLALLSDPSKDDLFNEIYNTLLSNPKINAIKSTLELEDYVNIEK